MSFPKIFVPNMRMNLFGLIDERGFSQPGSSSLHSIVSVNCWKYHIAVLAGYDKRQPSSARSVTEWMFIRTDRDNKGD